MRIAILQPSYLPWLGYLDQVARSDAFVLYDDVQYDKNGWRNRNRVRVAGADGWAWLTIPVRLEGSFPMILDVWADSRVPWRRKQRRAIENAYRRAPHFAMFDACFGELFGDDEGRLAEIAIASLKSCMRALGLDTPLFRSSELGIQGDRNGRLVNICQYFEASEYLTGSAARAYLDIALFERNGIAVEFQEYAHPTYPQRFEPFVSHLSALDAILNVGPAAREFLGKPVSRELSTSGKGNVS